MDDPDCAPDNSETHESSDDAVMASELKLAAMREFRERSHFRFSPPGSLTSLYLKERRALRRLFPGTLVDLARDGVIKIHVLGDCEPEGVPDRPQPDS